MLHRNEKLPFNIAGKPYLWVRVNGQLQLRPATTLRGGAVTFNDLALARLAGETTE